ncbi:YicC/YloC family endoribonuclease [Geobacillus thermoleovorans]|uniref:YicC/YloC family endoribonuclease n=1 Tax=Geobacillus thermoleovorans TaxID=33941 RepID=UPI00345C06E4
MVYSMTGFGASVKKMDRLMVAVEMKSVNHRFCEISIRLPRQWLVFEDKIKKAISPYVRRGKVEVFVTIAGEGLVKRNVHIDWNLLGQYWAGLQEAAKRFAIDGGVTAAELLRLEGAVEVVEEEGANEEVEPLLLDAVDEAAKALAAMRRREGEALAEDLRARLREVEAGAAIIEQRAPLVVEQYRERLERRLREWAPAPVDEARLLTEVAVFAEKADIHEELKRIRSHLAQMADALEMDEPVGRKLDFLVQELNREVNTIGAKANDSLIAAQVVEMKSVLEKMREQVQNVE